MQRQRPRWSELRELIRIRPPAFGAAARLESAATIWDLRRLARRRAPRAVFDYTDGAAEAEVSLRRSRRVFDWVEFVPSVLRGVAQVDTATTILGRTAAMPLALAPTGFTRMMHAAGETAVAQGAAAASLPYCLSTLGTTSIEDVAAAAPGADRWFQLYVWRDRGFATDLVERARAGGFRAIVLTVDTPVAGSRLRDVRNGLTIPPQLSLRTLVDGALHPAWWWDLLTTPPLRFANLASTGGTVADLINRVFDPALNLDDLAWLRSTWTGQLVVKGVQTAEDAAKVVDVGADAVIVSNHGGRQLDRAPTTLEALPSVVEEVGDRAEVFVDGGITSGADIAAAVAMGARAAMVGRAYLYGLMAGGRAGVDRALEILRSEYVRTLQLLGVTATSDLTGRHARLRPD